MPSFSLLPRDDSFFDLFERQAEHIVEAAEQLFDLLHHYEELEIRVERIRGIEHEGDQITHDIMAHLYRTFLTPIDREDIVALAERMDDVLDWLDDAAVNFRTYRVAAPTARAIELASTILKATQLLQKCISKLRHPKELRQITPLIKDLNQCENDADTIYRLARAELFACAVDSPAGVLDVLKWREIYEALETAVDRCEDVGNVLEGIIIKYT
ncbi:MAG: DUF47 family protein [Chloroflexi bacterium]|nr:DUF47 family protein [Chloroflexota bacterium]